MKKKAYMAPATDVTFTHLQQIICGSGKVTLGEETTGNTGITPAEPEDPIPTEADARRVKWDDDEDEYDD